MTIFDARGSDRRAFLKQVAGMSGALIAGSVIPEVGVSRAWARTAPTQPAVANIGVQLYTLGRALSEDFDGSMEKVANIGYKVVEFAGYGGKTPEQVRATLDRLGMKAPSTHIGMGALRDDFDGTVHIGQVVGHEYITIPSLGGDTPGTSADDWKRVAEEMNEMAARLATKGLKLGFHSHRDEYVDVGGGKKGMDIIMENTDPTNFAWEMDIGWAEVAGQDPLYWFKKYPGRIKMWHVKDISALETAQARQQERFAQMANPRPPSQAQAPGNRGQGGGPRSAQRPAVPVGGPVPVGAGDIDYKPIFAQWQTSGLEHYFVEQDGASNWPGGPFSAIASSYRNIVNMLT